MPSNSDGSTDNKYLVPILIVILCVLSVIVVVGGIFLFAQRDKNDALDTVALGSEISESNSSESSDGKDSATKPVAGKASNSKSSGAADPCNKIPLAYGYGKRAFSEDEAKRYWDDGEDMVTLVQYCDGKWAMWGQFGTDNGTGLCSGMAPSGLF